MWLKTENGGRKERDTQALFLVTKPTSGERYWGSTQMPAQNAFHEIFNISQAASGHNSSDAPMFVDSIRATIIFRVFTDPSDVWRAGSRPLCSSANNAIPGQRPLHFRVKFFELDLALMRL